MNPDEPAARERRRHERNALVATATVFEGVRLLGTYFVRDLSAGGAWLEGEVPLETGRVVALRLFLPHRAPLAFGAQVRRADAHGTRHRCAVTFVDVTPADEDALHEKIVSALEREEARRHADVLVLDSSVEVRDSLERDLQALGHNPLTVATPLEAVAWLSRASSRITTVIVDLSAGPAQGLDLLAYLVTELPQLRRVVMGDGMHPFRLELAVRSGRAHAALPRPWDQARLTAAVRGA